MKQNESLELRCEMATMHDFFLNKIDESIEEGCISKPHG